MLKHIEESFTSVVGSLVWVEGDFLPAATANIRPYKVFCTLKLIFSLSSAKCPRVYRLGLRAIAVFHLALACWIMDRLFCEAWLSIDFPYMHGLWHILIFITGYTCLVLCAYFNAIEERPDQKPQLRYWPRNDFEWGVPYVSIKKPYSEDNLARCIL